MLRSLDRGELYEAVWETPLSRLAKGYGISDVALKKACTRLGIPTPPRGYWAKLRHGHKVLRPPLPPPTPGAPTTYEVVDADQVVEDSDAPGAEAPRTADTETGGVPLALPPGLDPPPAIVVAQTLRNPDPLVAATKAVLEDRPPDEYGRIRSHGAPLAVDVHPESTSRALRLINAVVRAAKLVGFELRRSGGGGRVQLVIEGEALAFGVYERSRQERVPESERKRWSHSLVRYHPTGILELGVGESYSAKYRRSWRDTSTVRVEERLGDFLVGAYGEAVRQREERERREAYWQTWRDEREAERRRAEEAARKQTRREHLERQAASWNRSREVSAFIDAVEARATETEMSDESMVALEAWVTWAREHATRLDPLSRGLPHESDGTLTSPGATTIRPS